jgi:hypothetical protein
MSAPLSVPSLHECNGDGGAKAPRPSPFKEIGVENAMKLARMLLLLPLLGLGLAACAVPYDDNVPYAAYPYPDDYYMPGYGGVVWDYGGGWHYHWQDWNHHADAGHRSGGHHGHWHHA